MSQEFYLDSTATGTADGLSAVNAWTTFAQMVTGIAAYNGGTMATDYHINASGTFTTAARHDITGIVGNSATNFIHIDGGAWSGIRGAEPVYISATNAGVEAILVREAHVRLTGARIKTASGGSTSVRLFSGSHDGFIGRYLLLENTPAQENAAGHTRKWFDCIITVHTGTVDNLDTGSGTVGNQAVTWFYNCILDWARLVTGSYNTIYFINSVHHTSTAISKSATGTLLYGDYSSFYGNETATLDSSTGAIVSTGNVRAANFTDSVNGDYTYTATGLTAYGGLGIGPSSDANVPTTSFNSNTRSGTTTDIGVYMQATGGSIVLPLFIHQMRQQGIL